MNFVKNQAVIINTNKPINPPKLKGRELEQWKVYQCVVGENSDDCYDHVGINTGDFILVLKGINEHIDVRLLNLNNLTIYNDTSAFFLYVHRPDIDMIKLFPGKFAC